MSLPPPPLLQVEVSEAPVVHVAAAAAGGSRRIINVSKKLYDE
jgi:hypothetical protein